MFILIIAILVCEPIAGFAMDAVASIEAYGAHGEWLQEFLRKRHKTARHGGLIIDQFNATLKISSTMPKP